MSVPRAQPYASFNFLVTIGSGGDPNGPDGGFQEVSALSMEVGVAEYRYGNSKLNNTQKVTGLNKSNDVTLKRGVMGNKTIYEWFDAIRSGKNELKTVRIELRNEENSETVQTWILNDCRPLKFAAGPLNAKSNEIAMEELVLSFNRLEIE